MEEVNLNASIGARQFLVHLVIELAGFCASLSFRSQLDALVAGQNCLTLCPPKKPYLNWAVVGTLLEPQHCHEA
eukprot:4864812-Amphidinium_carterae.1